VLLYLLSAYLFFRKTSQHNTTPNTSLLAYDIRPACHRYCGIRPSIAISKPVGEVTVKRTSFHLKYVLECNWVSAFEYSYTISNIKQYRSNSHLRASCPKLQDTGELSMVQVCYDVSVQCYLFTISNIRQCGKTGRLQASGPGPSSTAESYC